MWIFVIHFNCLPASGSGQLSRFPRKGTKLMIGPFACSHQFNMIQFSRNIDQIAFTLPAASCMLWCYLRQKSSSTFNIFQYDTYLHDMHDMCICVCVCLLFLPLILYIYMHFGLIFHLLMAFGSESPASKFWLRHIRPTYCAWRTCHTLLRS